MILGSCRSTIQDTDHSSIIGGFCNNIYHTGCYSTIIGGKYNINSCAYAVVSGTGITTDRDCSTFVNNLSIKNIPTASTGLPSGSVWSNSGVLNIVP